MLAVLLSPVSGAFLALGLTGTLFASRAHRAISATTIVATACTLAGIGLYFGMPGPEGFSAKQGVATAFVLLLFLVARPPKYLTVVVAVCLAACPVLIAVPEFGNRFAVVHALVSAGRPNVMMPLPPGPTEMTAACAAIVAPAKIASAQTCSKCLIRTPEGLGLDMISFYATCRNKVKNLNGF